MGEYSLQYETLKQTEKKESLEVVEVMQRVEEKWKKLQSLSLDNKSMTSINQEQYTITKEQSNMKRTPRN